jgi:hypothetical protein
MSDVEETELFRLLVWYAAWDGLKPTFWVYLSVPSSGVKVDSLTLEDGADR